MSDYIWSIPTYIGERRFGAIAVIVLAWHGETATVIGLGEHGPVEGTRPFVVATKDLRFGRLPETNDT